MNTFSFLRAGVLFAAVLALSGCSGAGQKYYRLSSDGPAPTGTTGLAVGVGPVSLPAYVDRAELVFQNGPNQFTVPLDAHWTGSLKENVTRTLAADLGRRLDSGNVLSFPWAASAHLRYQIAVDISQFHAVSGHGAILEVAWRVLTPDGKTAVRRGNGSFNAPVHGDGYDPVVAAENNLLGQLADAIAATVRGR